MIQTRARAAGLAILLSPLLVVATAGPGAGQTPSARQSPPATAAARARPGGPASPETPGLSAVAEQDAQETRRQLEELLKQYPPSLGQVLRLDPSLLDNQDYLATYPALAAFLTRHPEVAHNPVFFVGQPDRWDRDPKLEAIRLWENVLAGVALFLVFFTVTGVLAWLIRALIDYRRWLRLSKVQTEAHSKLLERFTSNEDLLAYIQTPAGRRFLESAPIPVDVGPHTVGAPLGRILWSVQAGMGLAAAGLGLQFARSRVVAEAAEPLFVVGVLAFAVGAGFVLSAAVAYFLARHLGLFKPPPASRRADATDLSS